MATTQVIHYLSKDVLTDRLATMADGWRELALSEGQDVLLYPVGVGLLLGDLCDMLELDPEQRIRVLGDDLVSEISALVDTPLNISIL